MTDSFKSKYNMVRQLRSAESICVYIAAISLVLEFIATRCLSKYNLVETCQIITCVLSVVSLLLRLFSDYLLYQAEEEKRRDLIDNAFGSHISEYDIKGYYSNESAPKGIKKLAINNFDYKKRMI